MTDLDNITLGVEVDPRQVRGKRIAEMVQITKERSGKYRVHAQFGNGSVPGASTARGRSPTSARNGSGALRRPGTSRFARGRFATTGRRC